MRRPKIKIQPTKADWGVDIIGLIGVIFTVVLVIIFYNDLPDTIPTHYNMTGQPDGFGGKSMLFTFPALTVVTYFILTIGLRFPNIYNYPFEITEENAERQYKNITLMVRILKTFIVMIFGLLDLCDNSKWTWENAWPWDVVRASGCPWCAWHRRILFIQWISITVIVTTHPNAVFCK